MSRKWKDSFLLLACHERAVSHRPTFSQRSMAEIWVESGRSGNSNLWACSLLFLDSLMTKLAEAATKAD